MGYSEIEVSPVAGTSILDITARGGTRRQRGSTIAAYVRKHRPGAKLVYVSYSETYGFQSATYARYETV